MCRPYTDSGSLQCNGCAAIVAGHEQEMWGFDFGGGKSLPEARVRRTELAFLFIINPFDSIYIFFESYL